MDETQGGYYRDYHEDGLTMHFKAAGMDADYPLSAANANNILVVFEGKSIKIVNAFKPGAMPFLITSTFPELTEAAIETVVTGKECRRCRLQSERPARRQRPQGTGHQKRQEIPY